MTKRQRAKAGWLVALLYLFCVLAPGAALAVGNPAPWLPPEVAQAPTDAHPRSGHGLHEHGGGHAAHHADADGVKHEHDGKASPGPGCAMLCLSAMTADLPGIAKPARPMSTCVPETYRRLHGSAPPLPYRPPNA
ncbi:hypothetical protein [Bradyrhizobium cenepequi]|uniref:hypothetical protein n=1 Tax=Bradyrhizobium cenepequi TaxID=2821403 RepID=UPI001CE29000|nr:hypothetical protein [Bradyrhizobium cenepequi]